MVLNSSHYACLANKRIILRFVLVHGSSHELFSDHLSTVDKLIITTGSQ